MAAHLQQPLALAVAPAPPPATPRPPANQLEADILAQAVAAGYQNQRHLYPHQYEVVARIASQIATLDAEGNPHGLLIASDPGLGKTTSAIVGMALARRQKRRPCVVVAPVAVLSHWRRELEQLCPGWRVFDWSRSPGAKRTSKRVQESDVVLISIEGLTAAFKASHEKPADAKEVGIHQKWMPNGKFNPLYCGRSFSALVFDESHRFRNSATKCFFAGLFLARRARVRLCLTGTPLANSTKDVHNQLLLCNAQEQFRSDSALQGSVVSKTIMDLHATAVVRHTKSILGLPPLRSHTELLQLEGLDRDAACTAIHSCLVALRAHRLREANFSYVLSCLTQVRKVAVSGHMVMTLAQPEEPQANQLLARKQQNIEIAAAAAAAPGRKLRRAAELVEELSEQGRKCVVFCSFVAPLKALQKLLEDRLGVGCAPLLDSDLTGAARSEVVDQPHGRLHTDPTCRCLLSTLKAGGVGLNLAPAATAVIMMDCWWNPSAHRQAEDRVHRIGCVQPCDVYNLVYEESFDSEVRKLYHSFKAHNESALMKNDYEDEDERLDLSEGVTEALIEEVAALLGVTRNGPLPQVSMEYDSGASEDEGQPRLKPPQIKWEAGGGQAEEGPARKKPKLETVKVEPRTPVVETWPKMLTPQDKMASIKARLSAVKTEPPAAGVASSSRAQVPKAKPAPAAAAVWMVCEDDPWA